MKAGHGLLLATIAISMFLDGLDGTIVNVALPSIADDFGIGTGDTSWIVTVYFLMMSGLILVFGRICDMGAIKRVLIIGMGIFTLGSLFCGLSPSLTILLLSRAFQGVGAAMIASSAVMLGVKYLPKEKLGLAMSLVVLGSSFGVALGPTVGAVLTEYSSWHWIFFINVPIGILAILMAHKAVPADKGLEKGDLDLRGSALLFAAIVLGLFVIERIPSVGISASSLVALVGCVVLFAVFIRYERGRASPVLNLNLFRNRNFDMATMAYMLVNLTIMGIVYLMPFLLKQIMGLTTLESGLFLSLQSLSMIACCLVVGRISDKRGDRPFAILACVIMLVFTILVAMVDTETSLLYLGASLLVSGCIWGIGGGPMGARMVDSLDDEDRGSGSSMISFVMYFSSALGTALFAGLFGLGSGEGSGSISDVSTDAFMDGFHLCMIVAIVLAVVSIILSWALKVDRKGSE
ncbi:MAG: MFS transporter [Thermoplasmata archaeon]|nr:MFS transporter [Thermoplasmata archaeon]